MPRGFRVSRLSRMSRRCFTSFAVGPPAKCANHARVCASGCLWRSSSWRWRTNSPPPAPMARRSARIGGPSVPNCSRPPTPRPRIGWRASGSRASRMPTTMTPAIDAVSDKFAGRAMVGKLNVDEDAEIAARYGISSIPTVFLFKNGQVVDKLVGDQSEHVYQTEG